MEEVTSLQSSQIHPVRLLPPALEAEAAAEMLDESELEVRDLQRFEEEEGSRGATIVVRIISLEPQ